MNLVACTLERHGEAILAIFNDAIAHTTALYEYHPRPPESMAAWFQAKQSGSFPVLGIEDDDGTLLGFASYGTFRAYPAFKYTVEHSVYVHRDHRSKGVGRRLLEHLIDEARRGQVHAMIAAIDAENTASLSLHERAGFLPAGTIRQAGFKFGRWLDLAFLQLILPTPENPVDG